jgi:hypothetical protein
MLATLQWCSGERVACAKSNVDNGRNRCAEGESGKSPLQRSSPAGFPSANRCQGDGADREFPMHCHSVGCGTLNRMQLSSRFLKTIYAHVGWQGALSIVCAVSAEHARQISSDANFGFERARPQRTPVSISMSTRTVSFETIVNLCGFARR